MERSDSKSRLPHYEHGCWHNVTWKFNNVPGGARCNWHHEAQLSTTDSRKSPATNRPSRANGSSVRCAESVRRGPRRGESGRSGIRAITTSNEVVRAAAVQVSHAVAVRFNPDVTYR